jgi:hypothetical protein
MDGEQQGEFVERCDRRLHRAEELLSYSELTLQRMYSLRQQLEIAQRVAAELRIHINNARCKLS